MRTGASNASKKVGWQLQLESRKLGKAFNDHLVVGEPLDHDGVVQSGVDVDGAIKQNVAAWNNVVV